jgi:predicted flap endonuclease-1-like 5' DNA nuclease
MMQLNPFAGGGKGRSWFWWGINIGVILALAIWWWMENQPEERKGFKIKPVDIPDETPKNISISEVPATQSQPEEPDDLKQIEGIGPRCAQVLGEAGIVTFSGLAAMNPDAIKDVLRAAKVRVPYPATWPEQAALAAAGEWDALKQLQTSLIGGRRV